MYLNLMCVMLERDMQGRIAFAVTCHRLTVQKRSAKNIHSAGSSRRRTSIIFLATYRAVTPQWDKFVAIDCVE